MPSRSEKQSWMKDFVRYTLSDEDRADLKAWAFSIDDFNAAMENLSRDSYKITTSYDSRNNTWLSILQTTDNQHAHAELLLSARGSTAFKSVKAVVWVHYQFLQGIWTDTSPRSAYKIDD